MYRPPPIFREGRGRVCTQATLKAISILHEIATNNCVISYTLYEIMSIKACNTGYFLISQNLLEWNQCFLSCFPLPLDCNE